MKIYNKSKMEYIPEEDCLGYKIMNNKVYAICMSSVRPSPEYENTMMHFEHYKMYLFWKDVSEFYDYGHLDGDNKE